MQNVTTRLVQLTHPQRGRAVALVDEPSLILLKNIRSVYELAMECIRTGGTMKALVSSHLSEEKLDYDPVYNGTDSWKLLPSFDHPDNPFGCIVAGTGLTHKNSALNRQMMHQSAEQKPTDSMQMYQWGVEGGQPQAGEIGVQPEWFYKGTGSALRAHGEALLVPSFGNDGGEEPEVAGVYLVDEKGQPWRVGYSTGNEFSDHVMEKKNYLYLAPSKLRTCSIGPELVIDQDFKDIKGRVSVSRDGEELWSSAINTGEANMAHSLENLEHHHFKYEGHRMPFQAHIHFFGADAFSFGNKLLLQNGDVMTVQWEGLGRALKNHLEQSKEADRLVKVKPLK